MKAEDLLVFLGAGKFRMGELLRQNINSFTSIDRSVVEFIRQWNAGQEYFDVTTSGSTGVPKKTSFHRRQMEASARLTSQALGLKEGMTAMLCLDPQFIAGKMMIVRSLVTGMNLVALNAVANPLDHMPKEVLFIDFAALVPLQVVTALDSPQAPRFDNFGTVIIGGGNVNPELRKRLQNLRTSFYSTFGMTETITHIALQKLNGENQTDYMRVLPGVTISTDDRSCLIIHAPFVGEQPIVTNDIIDLIDPGAFKWLGRSDFVINSGGVKVIPEVVEPIIGTTLARLDLQNRFFVWGIPSDLLGQEVVLVIEGNTSAESEQSILSTLKAELPKYSAPRKIVYADRFVVTSTGKIRRSESIAKASPRPD